MCEIKTVLVFVALLVAAAFWIYRVHTAEKVGQQSKAIVEIPCENEYKNFFWATNAIISLLINL